MTLKRLLLTTRLFLCRGAQKRALYLKKKKVFHEMGDNCSFMPRVIPLYSNLISIGNNVHCASNTHFITHDVAHVMLNNKYNVDTYCERIGCIKIGNNVFVGANVTILMNVEIGDNIIIGANSVVTKSIPSNSVIAGVPAKIIKSFDEYVNNRKATDYPTDLKPQQGKLVSKDLEDYMWKSFLESKLS